MPGRILEAGVLFDIAVDAARNISAESRQEGQSAALVSVVFAVVSLEAFLNEANEVAQDVQLVKSEPEAVAAFAQLMEESERLPLETKFKLCTWLLTGKRADIGKQPYQDFLLLVGLRNALVHFKPNYPWNTFEEAENLRQKEIVKRLESKNILALKVFGRGSWTSPIQTKAVAVWACSTAAGMVNGFVNCIPQQGRWAFTLRNVRDNFANSMKKFSPKG
jgi:hypothetical protein